LAKRQCEGAAPWGNERCSAPLPAAPWRRRFRPKDDAGQRDRSSAGFTLIELLIVTSVLPIVVGALALGLISVFTLQGSVSGRLTDSGDAQLVSLNFQNDVQSAAQITTSDAVQVCGSGFQVLGLQLGNGAEISYSAAAAASGNAYQLTRFVCAAGSGSTVTSQSVLAHDLPSSVLSTATPPITITCTTSSAACAAGPNSTEAYQDGWVSTVGVTGVTFKVTAPASSYTYQSVAVPAAGSNSTLPAPSGNPSTGCGFATPATGNYASTLCFVDFAPWNSQTAASGVTCPTQSPGPTGSTAPLPMSAGIANTPFTLSFCLSVYSSAGNTSPGVEDINAVPLPTYSSPPTSEAFLGNNGFYTGVPGDPALYTVNEGSTATVYITNIQVLSSSGAATANWQLVTGDAESTDSGESITWASNQNLTLLPNTANSPVGNACDSTGQYAPPSYNSNYLTGVGSHTVTCSSTVSEDHTGTVMLVATTPSQLTVTLNGTGLQAMFLGVLL
jgi:prepilin-type N-terminal cleavage/methylation domain-containing protein